MRARRITLIMLLVTIFILSITFTIAFAATQKEITIDNRSKDDFDVTLRNVATGNISYTIHLDKYDIDETKVISDVYTISYPYCDGTVDFNVNMSDNYSFIIYPCAHQPTAIQVKSHLAEDVVLEIYGYEDASEDIDPGYTRMTDVFSGDNTYVYEACEGQTFSGEFYINKNGSTPLVLHSCEWHTQPARFYSQPVPVKFRIANHASYPIIMTLIGPESYLVTVNPDMNVFQIVSGSYKYSYYQDNQVITGRVMVTKGGQTTLVVTPSFVIGFVDDEELD
jgi:hypothetical protein